LHFYFLLIEYVLFLRQIDLFQSLDSLCYELIKRIVVSRKGKLIVFQQEIEINRKTRHLSHVSELLQLLLHHHVPNFSKHSFLQGISKACISGIILNSENCLGLIELIVLLVPHL